LVVDFSRDSDLIANSNSEAFKKYLLSNKPHKYWIQNPKIERVYPALIAMSEKVYAKKLQRERIREEQRRAAAEEAAERQRKLNEEREAIEEERLELKRK
jgi:hypothetical protein